MKKRLIKIMGKVFIMLVITGSLWALGANNSYAETLNLLSLPPTTFNGYYVGPVTGNINGGYAMSFYCNDFTTTTYVPNSFAVAVSTLSDLSQTKIGGTTDATFRYQEVSWLISQMESNPAQVGAIQFAAWSIFTSSTPVVPEAAQWVTAANSIDPTQFDFSSVRIYTATDTKNQEFMGGGAKPVGAPEPNMLYFLVFSFIVIIAYMRLQQKYKWRLGW